MGNAILDEEYVSTNGIRLHVVMAGPRNGLPVVLLHGFPESWLCWAKQWYVFAEAGCRVIIPDQRGYNLSDKPEGVKAYKLHILVDDIIGLIDALGYEKVDLVGHDWGAAIGWVLANKHPEKLHHLGILNVPHPAVMRRFLLRDWEQICRSWYIFLFQLPSAPEAAMRAGNWRGLSRAMRGSGKTHSFTNQDIESYKVAWSRPGAITAMINWYRAVLRYQPALPKDPHIRVPTLMLWGMRDIALSHRMARPSLDYCDTGKLVLFPDATHWVQRDAAEDVNRFLLDFLFNRQGE